MTGAPPFELARREPPPHLRGIVSRITGYRETRAGRLHQREASSLIVPLIISFGTPFRIALGQGDAAARGSFAAGLFAGPVLIESDGAAECLQVDFTPLGAVRFLGGAAAALADRMVGVEDLFGPAGRSLRERLGATPGWADRFDLVEDFVARRAVHAPSPGIVLAWRGLARGGARVAAVAAEVGWSRGHLVRRFRAEIGPSPKTVARMMRFHRACALARDAPPHGWAGIAADAGYADQAHLAREFAALAGETPTRWAGRAALSDSRIALALAAPAAW